MTIKRSGAGSGFSENQIEPDPFVLEPSEGNIFSVTPSRSGVFWQRSAVRRKLLPAGPVVIVKLRGAAVLRNSH